MPERPGFENLGQVLAVAFVALAIECGIVWCGVSGGAHWSIPIVAHVAVTAALVAWCYRSPAHRQDLRLPLLLVVTTGALGPVGAGGTLATIALSRWYMRKAIPFDEWYRSLFPECGEDPDQEFVERVAGSHSEDDGNFAAFADILAFGSLQQKQALITLIGERFRPAFGPILKLALADSNNAIRVQAATVMSRIENSIHERTLELKQKLGEAPEDLEAVRSLAKHFDDHLYSGILDTGRENEVRSQALAAYRQCVAAAPDDLGSRMALGRLLLRDKKYKQAVDCLEDVMAAEPATSPVSLWYMECLFHLGRFDTLRELARRRHKEFESRGDFPHEALDAVRLWAGGC